MQNILVTAAGTPLARQLLLSLHRSHKATRVIGTDQHARPSSHDGFDTVSLGNDPRELIDFLEKEEIDTVIHCGLAPDRSGSCDEVREAAVIDTMRLGSALLSERSRVRAWVVASSSAVYPASSEAPFLQREDGGTGGESPFAGDSVLDAEGYVLDVANRAPSLNVSLLRLQHLVGDGIRSPLCAALRQPLLPSVIGFDPPLQLLAIEDAVRALIFAAELELAGIYNVASAGMFRFSEAVRHLGRPALPVLPFEAGPLAGIARRLRIPHVPNGVLDLLRFGHALDTAKLTAAGFDADYDQTACLGMLRS